MKKIREAFPFLQKQDPWIYLDSAATTQKPKSVIDTLSTFYREGYATVHRGVYTLSLDATTQYTQVRIQVAQFLGAESPDEIVFTKGTTEGINLVANSFGKAFIYPGDEILIAETEHHSNILPWQMLAQEKGAILKVIPVDDQGEILFSTFLKLLSSKTKLLCIAHAANTTGTIHPIKKMIQAVHAHGGYVLVDGAQAASHLPIDVQELDADFYLFSGHKVYGPTGIGILYGKRNLLEKMPPYQLGGDMVKEVRFETATYQEIPLKFEAGTPAFAEVIGLGAALSFMTTIGKDNIHALEHGLLSYATAELLKIPHLKIIGTAKDKIPIISFIIPPLHPLDIGTLLSCKRIAIRTGHLCAQPTLRRFGISSLMRISFGVYNTKEEIDLCVNALKEITLSLRSPHGQKG